MWRRLWARLFASYLLVITVGTIAMVAVAMWLTQSLFADRLRQMGRRNGLGGASAGQIEAALTDSLTIALLVGIAIALVAAGLVAAAVGKRLLRPIDDVRDATHRMAQGQYDRPVSLPPEEELRALAEDVNLLGTRLADVESRRTRLIGEVAHEMKTPVTSIRAYMEGMTDGVIEPSPHAFTAVAEEASRLQRLADDLTLLSQAEEHAMPLRLEPADLGDIAERSALRIKPQFDHGEVDLKVEDHSPLPVLVDEQRVAQLLTNLLGNALTYTPAGGTVTVHSGRDGSTGWVEVTDTGRGIAPEQLDKIFERFYRIPDPNHPAGRGIGLTIARSIARAHDGSLTVRSDGPNTGAAFRLSIPLVE